MTPQDWRNLARVFSSGAREAGVYDPEHEYQVMRWTLERMAQECTDIAREQEQPAASQISCASCRQLKPGPGYFIRDGASPAVRICDDCNGQYGISQLLRRSRR